MNRTPALFLATATLALTGCVSKIETPASGPTAHVDAVVMNFSSTRSIIKSIENVYFDFKAKDGSWGGEDLVKVDAPTRSYDVPAGKPIAFAFKLMQSGAGYYGGCNANFDKSLEAGGNYRAEMTFVRNPETPVVESCMVALVKLENGQKNVVGVFGDGANVTVIVPKVKVVN